MRIERVCLALFAAAVFAPALSFAQETREEYQSMYVDFLKEEGYAPKVDSDGDVAFKAEGKNYYIEVNEDDSEYFRIVFPNFWEIESEDERVAVAFAASTASRKTKVAKVYLVGDNTSISAEILLSDPASFRDHFGRMIGMILTALETFQEEMEG